MYELFRPVSLPLAVVFAVAGSSAAQPRYLCEITPAATCDQQVPGAIISDQTSPTQNSFGPFVCTQFWGDGIMTASAFSGFGIVGVDIENLWTGCAAFGCGPGLLQINSSATHEFDVVFSSPTNDPIDVRMNIHLSGNIQEDPGLYRVVNARLTGPGLSWSGRFGQADQKGTPDIREGIFSSFDEITGSDRTTPEMVNVPVNTPVRFTMSIWVENANSLVTGGAVNFARGLRLQGTPFTITRTAPGVSSGDIGIDSVGANISGGGYGGSPCNGADMATPFGTLDLSDVTTFLNAFVAMQPSADLDQSGIHDLADVTLFITAFSGGCP
jgi:hypothetical protein